MEFASKKPCEKLLSHNNNILFQLTAKDNKSNGYSVSLEECLLCPAIYNIYLMKLKFPTSICYFPFALENKCLSLILINKNILQEFYANERHEREIVSFVSHHQCVELCGWSMGKNSLQLDDDV